MHTLGLWKHFVSLHYFCSKKRMLCLQCITSRILISHKNWIMPSQISERETLCLWLTGIGGRASRLCLVLWLRRLSRGSGAGEGVAAGAVFSNIHANFEQRKQMKTSFGRNLSTAALKLIELSFSHTQQFLTFIMEKYSYVALQITYLGKEEQTKQHWTRHKSSKLVVISV